MPSITRSPAQEQSQYEANKTNVKCILIVVILAVIVGGGVLAYQYWWVPKEEAKNSQKPVACTEEAKVCPDGSAVSRTGPNCEFAECQNPGKNCENDYDCACGVNKYTGECFFGYKNYVDTTKQCPDFCTGIAGNFELKCINGACSQVPVSSDGGEICKDLCGDGTCQEIVCLALGCPCAETKQSCPQDCGI
ncbi:MAG: hypothetical protein PHF44_04120 [Candidatus Pacebacteria bacterium]|nr:hypothetical protein [Candidatus Paceibacterota bacterium]